MPPIPGISGTGRTENITPRSNPAGNMQNTGREGAGANEAVNYDTQPVLGAAYPGVSGVAMAEELESRRQSHWKCREYLARNRQRQRSGQL